MKRTILLIALLPMLFSCGVSDERIDAYKRATKRVKKAASSEALEMISYNLSKELCEIDAEELPLAKMEALAKEGDERSREVIEAIEKARWNFNDALSDRETTFYIKRLLKVDESD